MTGSVEYPLDTIRKIGKVLRDVITEKRIHIMKTMKLLEEVSFPY